MGVIIKAFVYPGKIRLMHKFTVLSLLSTESLHQWDVLHI